MFERFENRFNSFDSCAEANEFSCRASASHNTNSALLLTMDTVFTVSIFAALRLIIISIIVILGRVHIERPGMVLVQ